MSNIKKDGGPAFSRAACGLSAQEYDAGEDGMSLRDYFAAHAPAEYLAVMAAKIQESGDCDTEVATIMAAAAFMYADAMLAEREKP